MALISQSIGNILNGVSQKSPPSRLSSQSEVQENMLDSPTRGKRRRPPTYHVAKLTATTTGYTSAFVHPVRRTATDRYFVVFVGGDLKVFDQITGDEQTVVFPFGKDYLTSTNGFRCITVGEQTFIVNRDTTVAQGTRTASAQQFESLLYLRQADFSTNYTVTLNGTAVTYTTPDQGDPASRADLDTGAVAQAILDSISANTALASQFTFAIFGNAIYVEKTDGSDFTLSVNDGLSDQGLQVVKGSVQSFTDLPASARNGMIVGITGDPTTATDNLWVQFSTASGIGVWQECAAPGTPIDMNPSTLPWTLTRKGTILAGISNAYTPLAPMVSYDPTLTGSGGFTGNPATGDVFDGGDDITLTDDGDSLTVEPSGFNSSLQTIEVSYDVDMTQVDAGVNLTVNLLYKSSGGGSFAVVASQKYRAGDSLTDELLTYTTTAPSGAFVEVQIVYGGGAISKLSTTLLGTDNTPVDDNRKAFVTIHRGTSPISSPGYGVYFNGTVDIALRPADIYPLGTVVTVTINSVAYAYTVTSADKTGAQVATGLYALINAATLYNATNPSDGLIIATNADSSAVTWTITTAVSVPALVFWSPGLSLTGGDSVGRSVVNTTTGASGVVASNGAHSLTLTSLTGGTRATFLPGDVCNLIGDAADFVFTPNIWADRAAGDLTSCPFPSMLGQKITEVFFTEDRLGFTAGNNVLLSTVGQFGSFVRQTAVQLLASDVIDVHAADQSVTSFDAAVAWNGTMYLWSDGGHQFELSGDPVLTPTTVRLDHVSSFPASGIVRPVALGSHLYFLRAKSAFTQVMEYLLTANGKPDANDTTTLVPEYITGSPLMLAGDAALEFMAVVASGSASTLWVCSYHFQSSQETWFPQKLQGSWSKWTFPGSTISGISMQDGVLSLILVRSDGVYLETIDLGSLPVATADHRDRQGSGSPVTTTVTWQLSRIFVRAQGDVALTPIRSRLQLRYASFNYHDATDFTVTVTPQGRSPVTYVFHSDTAAEGAFQVPIQSNAATVTIVVTNATTGGCAFSGIDWEGQYTARAKGV